MNTRKIERSLEGVARTMAPDVQIRSFFKGKKIIDINVGRNYKYFDLASLTKPIFTNSLVMSLYENKKINLKQSASYFLPWYKNKTIGQLLSHTAGNIWWYPFYKDLLKLNSSYSKWAMVQKKIRSLKLKASKKAVYSDIDYILLGLILERVFEKPLLSIQSDQFSKWGLGNIHFCENNKPKFKKSLYAPSEKCKWRQKTLQGEVNDENTWALDGVSSHAGLFGTIDGVSRWSLELRKSYFEKSKLGFSNSTTKRFFRKVKDDWSSGFILPSMKNSSCGDYFSKESIGHLAFTGCSFWYDIKFDLLVIILCNRTLKGREDRMIRKARPEIHNKIYTFAKEYK